MTDTRPFAAIARADLETAPFSHLIGDNILPRDLAETLLCEAPPLDFFARFRGIGSAYRLTLPSPIALASPRVSPRWKEALAALLDDTQTLLDLYQAGFGDLLSKTHPNLERDFAPLGALKAVPRSRGRWARDEVGMDVQIVANLPHADARVMRGPHIDTADKLISSILYLRAEEDDSVGGDLDLYERIDPRFGFNEVNHIDPRGLRLVKTIPMRHNALIMALNGPDAIHGVSPRHPTRHPRFHLHLVGQMAAALFAPPRDLPLPVAERV